MRLREYLAAVVTLALILSFISYLSYSGRSERAVRLGCAVLLLYGISLPIISFLSSLTSLDELYPWDGEYSSPDSDAFYESAEAAFAEGVLRLVASEYGASRDEVTVIVRELDVSTMRAKHISVYLSGASALLDYRSIQNYITEQGLGECEVFVSFG